MKQTVSMARATVPSPTASPKAAAPAVVVLCAAGMAVAVTSLCLLWIGYPPTTTTVTGTALADSALAERVLAAIYWYLNHAPHGLTLPLMHTDIGGPAVDLMVVEPKTMFA